MSECTHDCASCKEKCASPEIQVEKPNKLSSVKKVIGVVSGKGGVGKSLVSGSAGERADAEGLPHRGAGCRPDRPVRSRRCSAFRRQAEGCEDGILPALTQRRRAGDVHQSAAGGPGRPRRLARAGHRRHGQAVLDRRHLERRGLYVRRYAAGDGRRAADRVPVAAGGRHRRRRLAAGACRDDRGESCEDGDDDERARSSGWWRT